MRAVYNLRLQAYARAGGQSRARYENSFIYFQRRGRHIRHRIKQAGGHSESKRSVQRRAEAFRRAAQKEISAGRRARYDNGAYKAQDKLKNAPRGRRLHRFEFLHGDSDSRSRCI